ncbi:hypothetical protein BGZ98_010340 [Dissophora globulifera]|nr:hypothetical protein BGZ98_010340 [Dissophora globulifera]
MNMNLQVIEEEAKLQTAVATEQSAALCRLLPARLVHEGNEVILDLIGQDKADQHLRDPIPCTAKCSRNTTVIFNITSLSISSFRLDKDPSKEIYNHPDLGRYAAPSKLNVPHLGHTSITYCEIPAETSVVQFIHAIDTQIRAVMFHRPSFSQNKGKCLTVIFHGRSAAKKALTEPVQWKGIPYSAAIAGRTNYDIQKVRCLVNPV